MTTVVVDRRVGEAPHKGVMVTDNQCTTNGGYYKAPCTKIYVVKQGPNAGHILSMTGHEGSSSVIWDMYQSDKLRPKDLRELPQNFLDVSYDNDDQCEVVILRPDGIWIVDHWLRPYEMETEYYATGHGCQFAIGALDVGADPIKALTVAAERDPYTSCLGRPPQVAYLAETMRQYARRRKGK